MTAAAIAGARLLQTGDFAGARRLLEAAVRITPRDGRLLNNLAIARRRAGDPDGALAALRQAMACADDDLALLRALAAGFARLSAWSDAAEALRRVLAHPPAEAVTWHRYGRFLARAAMAGNRVAEAQAAAAFRRALSLDSGIAGAWQDLGNLSYRQGRLSTAIACWRCAVAIDPAAREARLALAIACRDTGQVAAAGQRLGSMQAAAPADRDLATHRIFLLDFDAGQDTAGQQSARRAWAAAIGHQGGPMPLRQADPERRLRIGYVSADFNTHSAATTFAAPILYHDRDRFHVTCYATRHWRDAMTDRFRSAAASWRDVHDASDEALAAQVRQDRIDILIDLSGHSPGHRLGAFALRAAPLQASGWGHCTGTGLSQMDALLVDRVLVPPAERGLFAESVTDLPCALSYLPFEPPPPALPPDGLAAHRGGERQAARGGFGAPAVFGAPVVFGALGRGGKLGPEAVRLWAQVLHAVSDSRLFLKDPQYLCRHRQRQIALQFAARGIDPSRLSFAAATDWAGHMKAYWKVDIALDTLPHGGGVTTLEALWMGVPVVSLYGRFPSARIGAAILSACGRADWVAADPAGYVAIARRLAADAANLRDGRADLRRHLASAPPYDPHAYAGAVEAVYRRLWKARCRGDQPG